MVVLGKNLIVSLDGIPIAAARTCTLNLEQEFIEACSPADSRVILSIPTLYRWSVSVDGLVGYSDVVFSYDLANKLKNGTKCLLTFEDSIGQMRAGWVYVKNCDQTGTVGSIATYSASFQPTGPLYDFGRSTLTDMSNSLTLSVSGLFVTYNFESDSHTVGVGILNASSTKSIELYININSDWALYDIPPRALETAITNKDTETLDDHNLERGNSSYPQEIITISPATVVSLMANAAATTRVVLRLY